MAENAPPASTAVGANGDVPGQPFYDKARAHLKDLLQKKRLLERSLAQQEESIYKKETDYLEDTPSGNIITGFEAYTKGSGSSAPGQRRRAAVQESNRVFSRSSISYNVNAVSWFLLLEKKDLGKSEVEDRLTWDDRNLQWKLRSQHQWQRCQTPLSRLRRVTRGPTMLRLRVLLQQIRPVQEPRRIRKGRTERIVSWIRRRRRSGRILELLLGSNWAWFRAFNGTDERNGVGTLVVKRSC